MVFSPTENAILPESTGDPNKPPTMIDISVIRGKGGNNLGGTGAGNATTKNNNSNKAGNSFANEESALR